MEHIKYTFNVEKDDFDRAGEASSSIKKILRQLGIDAAIIRRIAIASYEAEINIVIHSLGGNIDIEIDPVRIRVVASDRGPGIEDIFIKNHIPETNIHRLGRRLVDPLPFLSAVKFIAPNLTGIIHILWREKRGNRKIPQHLTVYYPIRDIAGGSHI
jgi:hypothetical protein